ncbi:hypothetical protein ADU90_14985 [Clostridium botulinum]|nr:hypothetical protein ADU90_14985 [Clostridium botulinum]KOC56616.1 hypothetical protein ADU89_02505 [Clostridium botulinum]MCD3307017.1 hypothetical protein [Clostridium botulinum D/C]
MCVNKGCLKRQNLHMKCKNIYILCGDFHAYDSHNLKITQSYTIKIPKVATVIIFLSQYYTTPSENRTIKRMEFSTPPEKYFNLAEILFHANCV